MRNVGFLRWLKDRLRQDQQGNATVEFALVAPILLAVALAVLQLAIALHVRATLTAAAAEGARAAALSGSDLAAGERRTWAILQENIGSGLVQDITVQREWHGGALVISVQIDAALPLLGFYGPTQMSITGHALQEHA
ncbi:MAG: pilus assembly protein [Candidatus Nanopelagicales bacterium]|nr:pilus assembly protein [Candidatus Nanopelagicales bacterium]